MKFYTAGESHGDKLIVVIEDVPLGISLTESDINFDLARRSRGFGRSSRQLVEKNDAKIISGVSRGKTIGSPVCIEISNYSPCEPDEAESLENVDDALDENQTFNNFEDSKECYIPRPGHADLPAAIKYGVDDLSSIRERSSARETAARVAAGVVAKNMLGEFGTEVYSYVTSIGSISADISDDYLPESLPSQAQIEVDELRCPDTKASEKMQAEIKRALSAGDTLGGKCTCVAVGVMPGLGSFMQSSDRIDSQIAGSLFSIPSVKSVDFGRANYAITNVGSAVVDQITGNHENRFLRSTNYAGGVEGGITNGMPLVANIGVKPVPTVKRALNSIDLSCMEDIYLQSEIRHDTCVVPAVGVIAEAEIAIILANCYCKKFGFDSMTDILNAYDNFITKLRLRLS